MAKILLIDDDPDVLDAYGCVLALAGYGVVQAESGDAALDRIQYADVSLAVTDVAMPGRDGLETLRALKGVRPDLPVVIMTGGSTAIGDRLSEIARDLGAAGSLRKPVDPERLLQLVERLIPETPSRR